LIFAMFIVWNLIVSIKLALFIPEYTKNQKTEERYQKYLPQSKRVSK
jgi:competence protein ComGC